MAQVTACRPSLAAELLAVRPEVLVALGATAAGSVFGSGFRLTQHRGERLPWPPESGDMTDVPVAVSAAFATVHPSSVLRAPDEDRRDAYDAFVTDLRTAAGALS